MTLILALQDISGCTAEEISLGDRGLLSQHIEKIAEALNANSAIKKIDLSQNNLDDNCVDKLYTLQYVTDLNLSHNNIDSGALKLVKKFKTLDLSQNNISESTAKAIIALDRNQVICKKLDLTRNQLSPKITEQITSKIQPTISGKLPHDTPILKRTSVLLRENDFTKNPIPKFLI
jgi:Leucine Rich repeat